MFGDSDKRKKLVERRKTTTANNVELNVEDHVTDIMDGIVQNRN